MADDALVTAAQELGFRSGMVVEAYEVPFARLIERFERRDLPVDFSIVPADRVEASMLFELDEQLRQDVPGTDGWVGRRDWFDDELASPEFDPTGYLVATDTEDCPIGLVRFWRNDPIPRLGLLGVLPRHRNGRMASDLLAAGLHGASGWGSAVFSTETARPSLQRRLERCGARYTGTFAQMVLDHRLT